ncbi:hypothetical protein D1BOALGB6SA_3818 [Olavius sp. associated proteobacterium Delta 1]|nr:hypothetical protein D1BOALGB6SA_3818 [Olavius sp. associated proteobacterium Delta 1]
MDQKISAEDLKNSEGGWLKFQLDQPCPLVYPTKLSLYSCQALRKIEFRIRCLDRHIR